MMRCRCGSIVDTDEAEKVMERFCDHFPEPICLRCAEQEIAEDRAMNNPVQDGEAS